MVHADVHHVMGLARGRQTQELAEYVARLLSQLAAAGAEVATIPAFSPQVCAGELEVLTPLPLISPVAAIVAEATRRKLGRTTVLGAHVSMETGLFGRLQDVTEVVPLPDATRRLVGDVYDRIVANEGASPEEFEMLRSLAHRLIEHEGVGEILFAGTDQAFVFRPENTDFPHLDAARTHIEAIMRAVTRPLDETSTDS
jgi:aspartate racemase